jgi:uncharacterized membrane protein YoaK (UPF0700 family)
VPIPTADSSATHPSAHPSADSAAAPRWETRLPTLLSVIAGMVDLIGFLTLGHIFTAHITGNIVVLAAVLVSGGALNLAQALAIPVFMLAVAAVWLLTRTTGTRGPRLIRLLLLIQFLLLAAVLTFSVVTHHSANPHGVMAGIAIEIAVSAMACQFALLRLALPGAPSTAVMTGNLTSTVLSLLDTMWSRHPVLEGAARRLRTLLPVVLGFFGGCVAAAIAVTWLGDWVWSLPTVLAGVAVASNQASSRSSRSSQS